MVGLKNAEICQLSAVQWAGQQQTFDRYVLPKNGISQQASQANKLTIVAGHLLYKSKLVNAITLTECLKDFITFLKSLKSKIILVAHNGKVFDSRILVKAIIAKNMLSELQSVLTGFIDTLPMLKKLLPDRNSYKQEELVKGCLNKTYDAHNGLEDVKSLRDLLVHLKPQNAVLASHSFHVEYVCESIQHHARMTTNFPSFKDLVSKKVLSKAMPQKIADSGLNLQQIRLIHARGGYDGLQSLLSTKQRGHKSRVTASKKVLRTLSHHLSKE